LESTEFIAAVLKMFIIALFTGVTNSIKIVVDVSYDFVVLLLL